MRTLTIEVNDRVCLWLEARRGIHSPEEFIRRSLEEYISIDEKSTAVRITRMHDDLSERIEELQSRIRRLNESLGEYRTALLPVIR